jgi:phage/plasmid-associated DNA primase
MSGGDPITTRALYQDNITYIPQFVANIQCNNKPSLGKIDGGIQRRLKIIPYKFEFKDENDINTSNPNHKKRDYLLPELIKNEKFINEFMLLLIEYTKKFYNEDINKIIIPENVKNETNDYMEDNNHLLGFIKNGLEITNNEKDRIKTSDLHSHYTTSQYKDKFLSPTDFKQLMLFNGFTIKKSGGLQYYINIKIKEFIDEDEKKENDLDKISENSKSE